VEKHSEVAVQSNTHSRKADQSRFFVTVKLRKHVLGSLIIS